MWISQEQVAGRRRLKCQQTLVVFTKKLLLFYNKIYIKENIMARSHVLSSLVRFFSPTKIPSSLPPAVELSIQNKLPVDFGGLRHYERKQFIRQLATINVKTLHLINCNIYDERCCGTGDNYLPKIYQELVKNPYIETLKLDKQFISSFCNNMPVERPHFEQSKTQNKFFNELLKMTPLRTLIIPDPDDLNFEHLSEYLTCEDCQLHTLEITSGLKTRQIRAMETILPAVNSLKTYKGSGSKHFQEILDIKWGVHKEAPQSNSESVSITGFA